MTDVRVCKVCQRVLERHILDGVTTYRHHAQDSLTDHAVVPVDPADFSPRGRCDFCNSDGTSFILPAHDFIVGVDQETGATHANHGGWSACTSCAVLLEANQWSALSRHVRKRWETAHGLPFPPDKKARQARVWRLLRANITGSLRPIE